MVFLEECVDCAAAVVRHFLARKPENELELLHMHGALSILCCVFVS